MIGLMSKPWKGAFMRKLGVIESLFLGLYEYDRVSA